MQFSVTDGSWTLDRQTRFILQMNVRTLLPDLFLLSSFSI